MKVSLLNAGIAFEGFYLIGEPNVKTDKNGNPFLECKLTDNSGTIGAKMWDYKADIIGITSAQDGYIVKVRGSVSDYKGKPQVTIAKLRLKADEDDVDLSEIVPSAPIDADATIEALMTLLVSAVTDKDYLSVCLAMWERFKDVWTVAPAATKMHHAFLHGLLMHTYNMVRIAYFVSGVYEGVVNRSLLVAGTFLHDFGKVLEYSYSATGLTTGFTPNGLLLGHLVIGAMEVRDTCKELDTPAEKAMLLEHLLLSHHGQPDWGAAVMPMCIEAELLSLIDVMDARSEEYREAMDKAEKGAITEKVVALGNRRIYVPSDYKATTAETEE